MSEPPRRFGVADADRYWRDRRAARSDRPRRLHRFLADLIRRLCPAGGKVLDCGVGSGHVWRLLGDHVEMYGVDLAGEALAGYGLDAARIRRADLNDGVPDFGLRFDVILASMVLHWLDDPGAFLDRARDRLAPAGRLIVVIPNITYYRHRIAYLFGRFPPISLSHRNFQTPGEFEAMARGCGWRIERRCSPKRSWRARLWPKVFAQDVVYVLAPA
jgi:SAM-dependent methyltransferase